MSDTGQRSDPDPAAEAEHGREAGPVGEGEGVNLFTVSAMRLHLPRRGLPPTPGTEPSLVQRLARRVRRAKKILDAVRERLLGR